MSRHARPTSVQPLGEGVRLGRRAGPRRGGLAPRPGGGLGALALTVENVHQSWRVIYLIDVLLLTPATAAVGPAVFAAVVALARCAMAGWACAIPPPS